MVTNFGIRTKDYGDLGAAEIVVFEATFNASNSILRNTYSIPWNARVNKTD